MLSVGGGGLFLMDSSPRIFLKKDDDAEEDDAEEDDAEDDGDEWRDFD
jgi:hypothetical protein